MTSTVDFITATVGEDITISQVYYPSAGYSAKLKCKDCLELVDHYREVLPGTGAPVRLVWVLRACKPGYRLVNVVVWRPFDLQNSLEVFNHVIDVKQA